MAFQKSKSFQFNPNQAVKDLLYPKLKVSFSVAQIILEKQKSGPVKNSNLSVSLEILHGISFCLSLSISMTSLEFYLPKETNLLQETMLFCKKTLKNVYTQLVSLLTYFLNVCSTQLYFYNGTMHNRVFHN